MPRITVKYPGSYEGKSNHMLGSYGTAKGGDSIYTEAMSECVTVVVAQPAKLSLYHIGGGTIYNDDKAFPSLIERARTGRVAIVYGPDCTEGNKAEFKKQPQMRDLIAAAGAGRVVEYTGSSVEVFPDASVFVDGIRR
jgi:hypothetical protein